MNELFGNRIHPACLYCEDAYPTDDKEMFICRKKGMVKGDFFCRSFRYDPLMRMPRRPLEIEQFDAEDFIL